MLTDRQDEANSSFSRFFEKSNKKARTFLHEILQMQYGSKIRTLTVHSHVPITFAHLSLLNVEQVINQPTSTIS